jgi:leader peptidase (prepilin peptidase)/N-methyltransferase
MLKSVSLLFLHFVIYGGIAVAAGADIGFEGLMFAILLIWISVIDIKRFEIPDLAVLLLLVSGAFDAASANESAFIDRVVGAIIWPLLLWSLAFGFRKLRGFDGLGFGDVKLVSGLGIWLGFTGMIWVVMAASLSGIVLLCGALAFKNANRVEYMQSAVAFGPFLCLCAWGVNVVGPI